MNVNQASLLSYIRQLGLVDGWRWWSVERLYRKARAAAREAARRYREHAFYLEKKGLADSAHALLSYADQLDSHFNDS